MDLSFLSSLDLSPNQNMMEEIAKLSGPVYAVVNIIKRVTGIQDNKVILVSVGISVFVGVLVSFTLFEPFRNLVYAVFMLFLGALGVDASSRWQGRDSPEPEPEPPTKQPLIQGDKFI